MFSSSSQLFNPPCHSEENLIYELCISSLNMAILMQLLLLAMLELPSWLGIIDVKRASGQCLSKQKELLLQLRNNLTYDTSLSTKLVNWDVRTDCCNWRGVECDEAGRVVGLDISSESISGHIDDSSSLFSLQFLQRLNLAGNDFDSTQLPPGFGLLKEMIYLNLSETGFAGQIPGEFSQLSRLVTLDLSSSSPQYMLSLKLQNPNLQVLVRDLKRLRELHLNGVDIAAKGSDWCQALSSSLPDLQVLSMSNCNLSGALDSSLAKLKSLSVIHLDENTLSSPLPDFLAEFPNLSVLTAATCGLLGVVPQKIFQITTLRTLDLSNNRELVGSLPEFPQNASLQNLDLSYTKFSGNLPDSIGNLMMLSSLSLFGCNFSGPIPSSISNLSRLVSIVLSVNHFGGSLPLFSLSRKLTTLGLRDNNLVGNIPSQWEGLKNLNSLDLSDNLLEGNLPPFLITLPALGTLVLSNNKFSGQINELESVSLSPLSELDLSGNNFHGPLPQFLFKITGLISLSLASNEFSGSVELTKFVELRNLVDLDLSHNRLSVGTSGSESAFSLLPEFNSLMLASCKLQKFPILKNQSRLNMLDLSGNQITGEIPNWLWDLHDGYLPFVNLSGNQFTRLQEPYHFQFHEYLDLHSNMLAGGIPLPPRSAAFVDFSNNRFNSSIPSDIGGHLPSAISFNIAKNSITGDIPLSLCNANRLKVLDMSDNSLSSSIPQCLIEKSRTIEVLNLHGNKLSGSIPDKFPEDCHLETLDLSYNILEGEVPKSLVNCKTLKELNLGHNRIHGASREKHLG